MGAKGPNGVADVATTPATEPEVPQESKNQPIAENPRGGQAGSKPIEESNAEPLLAAEPALPAPRISFDLPKEKVDAPPDGGEPSFAAPPTPPSVQPSREAALAATGDVRPEIQVATSADGNPVLKVRYPWQKLPRPSIQIARADNPGESAKPLALDGVNAVEVWRGQVERLNKPTYPSSVELVKTSVTFLDRGQGELITIRGRENLLGKTAAYAVDEKAGTPVICYLLDRWADEQGVLHFALGDFDLTREFNQAGKVHIWLLSEEQIVWEETVDWPGQNAASSVVQQPDGVSPPMAVQPDSATGAASSVQNKTPADPAMPNPPTLPALPEVSHGKTLPEVAGPGPSNSAPDAPLAESIPPALPQQPAEPSPGWKPMETKPSSSPSATPSEKLTLEEMSIDQLARHIENEFSSSMSPKVRRFWLNGYRYYYVVPNPPEVRRTIFMDMLRSAYAEKPAAELAEAMAALFQKLKAK
ncbi:MAG: hypothetical protein GXY83_20675 [Rhodopirellula sp.]|nr:hypothetical protein [Rhodopirellula sp.]